MSAIHISLHEFEEQYPWESEAQKKGFGALCKDIIESSKIFSGESEMAPEHRMELSLMKVAAWFIQKDHESNEWYNERIGALDSKIHNEMKTIIDENRALRGEIEELKAQVLKK